MSLLSLTKQLAQLPTNPGLYLLLDQKHQALWLGLAANLFKEVRDQLPSYPTTVHLEAFPLDPLSELPALYCQLLHKHRPLGNPLPLGAPGYPYLQLTGDMFPRIQFTTKPSTESIGPVLPFYGLPKLLDQLTQSFRLRSCDISIDGSFPLPCIEFFRKRCLAPCVREFCDGKKYERAVAELWAVLTGNASEGWHKEMLEAVAHENFEAAALLRDKLQMSRQIQQNPDFVVGASSLTDTFTLHDETGVLAFHLRTRHTRKKVGELLFRWNPEVKLSPPLLLEHLLLWYYSGDLPSEIRIPFQLPHQRVVQQSFDARSGGRTKIRAIGAQRGVMARFAAQRAVIKNEIPLAQPNFVWEVAEELQCALKLTTAPAIIQGFDVAHLSGQYMIASVVTWDASAPTALSYSFHQLEGLNEPDAMQEAVQREAGVADLVLVDGGKTQLRRALTALRESGYPKVVALAAVKPPGQSHLIAHFLTSDEEVLSFSPTSVASKLLYRLRDAAHELANSLHRQWRDGALLSPLTRLLPDLTETQRQLLLQHFGTLDQLRQATPTDLKAVLDEQAAKNTVQRLRRLPKQAGLSVENYANLPLVQLAWDQFP